MRTLDSETNQFGLELGIVKSKLGQILPLYVASVHSAAV